MRKLAIFFAALMIGACGSSQRTCEDNSQCLIGERCVNLVCAATPDAAMPQPDGPVATPDAPMVEPDGPVPTPDAAVPDAPEPDAEVPAPDAEAPDAQAPDAEVPDAEVVPECAVNSDCGTCGVCVNGMCGLLGESTTYYLDADLDDFGDGVTVEESCTQPSGYVLDNTDCDDTDPMVNPGAVESCNSVDDDCDGAVDENNPGGGASCGTETGECEVGVVMCTEGNLVCVGDVGPSNGPDDCDGADTDCDGATDEDFVVQSTECGVGACFATGETLCASGLVQDSCVEGDPSNEECDDSADNDCDGATDNGCACVAGVSRSCGSSVGECVEGTQFCTDANMWSGCVGDVGPSEEICESILDEDCDGAVDEDCACVNNTTQLCGSDVGECMAGVQLCSGGAWGPCGNATGPNPELCDGLDNDCDGAVDEPLTVDEFDLCGTNEGTCSVGLSICVNGALDCFADTTPVSEVCGDGVDQDCDGADLECPPEPDAGVPDGPTPDIETPDGATPDAGVPDGSIPDAATPDAATPDGPTPTPTNQFRYTWTPASAVNSAFNSVGCHGSTLVAPGVTSCSWNNNFHAQASSPAVYTYQYTASVGEYLEINTLRSADGIWTVDNGVGNGTSTVTNVDTGAVAVCTVVSFSANNEYEFCTNP